MNPIKSECSKFVLFIQLPFLQDFWFCTTTVVSELVLRAIGMTKNQDEALRREVVELGSVVRTFTNKNEGMEQTIRSMEFRQDATEK